MPILFNYSSLGSSMIIVFLLTSFASSAPSHKLDGFASDLSAGNGHFDDDDISYYESLFSKLDVDTMVKEMENMKPSEIQLKCPQLEDKAVDAKIQLLRNKLMQFLERDAFRLIEAYSKLVDKTVDTCGQKEENKFSIKLMRTVQENYMEPLLSWNNTWHGWKYLAIVLIVCLIISLGYNVAWAFKHFGWRPQSFIQK